MKKVVSIILVVALISAIVLVLKTNKKNNQEKTAVLEWVSSGIPVQIEVVKQGKFSNSFVANGILEPIRELAFVSDVSGRVLNILVDKGSRVSKGQTLVGVDDEMLKADFLASEAAYLALKTDYERFKNASEKGGVTTQQTDNIRTQYIAAESRYLISKRRLADASIKAPISGMVNERYIQVGALLNPGTRLFDIVDDTQLKLRCNVSERQVLKLAKGQKTSIRCTALPTELFEGTISFIGAKADRGLNFPVEISIENAKGLKPGMYVSASFDQGLESEGLLIPRNAVSGSVRSASVFVVKNSLAEKREVTIGTMTDQKVEILQGLQDGDSIVVAGLINVSDGARVFNKK